MVVPSFWNTLASLSKFLPYCQVSYIRIVFRGDVIKWKPGLSYCTVIRVWVLTTSLNSHWPHISLKTRLKPVFKMRMYLDLLSRVLPGFFSSMVWMTLVHLIWVNPQAMVHNTTIQWYWMSYFSLKIVS